MSEINMNRPTNTDASTETVNIVEYYYLASDSTDSVAQAEESGFIKHSIHPALDENDVIEEPTDKSKRSRRPKSKASGADVEPSSRKGSKKRSASKKKSRSRSRSTKRVKKIQ